MQKTLDAYIIPRCYGDGGFCCQRECNFFVQCVRIWERMWIMK